MPVPIQWTADNSPDQRRISSAASPVTRKKSAKTAGLIAVQHGHLFDLRQRSSADRMRQNPLDFQGNGCLLSKFQSYGHAELPLRAPHQ